MPGTKIATCSYCGTRAALVISRDRHELTCAACGAPLHDIKRMPAERAPQPVAAPRPFTGSTGAAASHARWASAKPRKPKRRKSFWRKALEEAFDVIEDIID